MAEDKYKQDGVNIELGDDFSSFCGKLCKSTYKNSHFVEVLDLARGNFRGPRGFTLKNLPKGCIQTMVADGIGTKVVPIVASGQLKTAASNVIAMTAMDITRYGGLPLVFVNILDVNSLGDPDSETYNLCVDTMLGLKKIANEHHYVVLGGETAELNNLFTPPAIMKKCASWRGLLDEQCYRTWNGGQGALVVINKTDVDVFSAFAKDYGLSTRVAGQITEKKDYNVKLQSKFSDKIITY